MIYDINGNAITDPLNQFIDNTDMDYEYDSSGSVNYTVIRVYRTKIDGTKQYPFVYVPFGVGTSTWSTLDMMCSKKFPLGINAGVFDGSTKPSGLTIQNGVLLKQGPAGYVSERRPLIIDADGNLGCVADDADGNSLINNGVVSAVCGFGSIIENYAPIDVSYIPNATDQAQRQIIGQFGNGDYAILTCEGRNHDHSDGWTMAEAQAICQKIGLKFAYNLDGGGSTETVVGKRQTNTIYEGTTGRKVPTFIVFNGSSAFGEMNMYRG